MGTYLLFAYDLSKLPLWLGKIYPISRLKSKAFIIPLNYELTQSCSCICSQGATKAGQVCKGGEPKGPCALRERRKRGSRARIWYWGLSTVPHTVSNEQGPGAITAVPSAAKADGTKDKAGDRATVGVQSPSIWEGQGHLPQHHWSQTEMKWVSWAVGRVGDALVKAGGDIKASACPQGPDTSLQKNPNAPLTVWWLCLLSAL